MAQLAGFTVKLIAQTDFLGHFLYPFAVAHRHPVKQRRQRRAVFFQRQQKVFKDRLILEHGRALELAADALPHDLRLGKFQKRNASIPPDHPALIGFGLARHDIHEGGLACAVGANDRAHFRRANLERQVVDGPEAVKGNRHARHFQKHAHLRASSCCKDPSSGPRSAPCRCGAPTRRNRSNKPPMPLGAKSVTSTKDRPKSTCHQSTQLIR